MHYSTNHGSPREGARREAFSLIEVLAILAVIVVLVGLTLGITQSVTTRKAETKARADLEVLALALEAYRAQGRDYPWVPEPALAGTTPRSEAGTALLRALLGYRSLDPARPELLVRGSFLSDELLNYGGGPEWKGVGDPGSAFAVDPWGRPYLYLYRPSYPRSESAWRRDGFLLLSAGPDGEVFLPPDALRTGLFDRAAYEAHPANADNITWNR